jgi:hypothetical protein
LKKQVLKEIEEKSKGPSFGIEGVGLVGQGEGVDPRALYNNN